jgi:hypothetical protein
MKIQIAALQKKEIAKKSGFGTFKVCKIKVVGRGDTVYELSGWGDKDIERFAPGSFINGFFSERTWGTDGRQATFNRITAEYVYDLLVKMNPGIEAGSSPVQQLNPPKQDEWSIAPLPTNVTGPANDAGINQDNEPGW